MLFHWYLSYHWYQWRPSLSPLTPMESICEYWTTLPFLVRGTKSGALEGRVGGESNLIFFIARGELAFLFRQTDYLAPFFIQSISPFSGTPSSTLFLAKFFVYVTSGWKFDRKDQTSLSLKIASGGSNSIVFQNSRRIFIDMLHLYGTRGEY